MQFNMFFENCTDLAIHIIHGSEGDGNEVYITYNGNLNNV